MEQNFSSLNCEHDNIHPHECQEDVEFLFLMFPNHFFPSYVNCTVRQSKAIIHLLRSENVVEN